MSDPSRIGVDLGEGTAASARLFRYGAEPRISITLKVTLDVAQQGVARCIAPEPIVELDERDRTLPGAPVRRASEVAIVKSACDVTVVGPLRAASLVGRIAIFRNGVTLLDKAVTTPSSGGAATGVGPLGGFDPSRAVILPAHLRATAETAIPLLQPDFPWAWFQCAPRDLQAPFLEGDEWILLEGFSSDRPDTRARLPMLQARGALVEPSGVVPLGWKLDTLAIDTTTWTASVLYRCVVPLRGALREATIVARVASGSEPTLPSDLHAVAAAAPRLPLVAMEPKAASKSSSTVVAVAVPLSLDAGAPFALGVAQGPGSHRAPASVGPFSATGPASMAGPSSVMGPGPRSLTPPRSVAPWQEPQAKVTPAAGTARTVALDLAQLQPPLPSVAPGASPAVSPWAVAPPSAVAPPAAVLSPWAVAPSHHHRAPSPPPVASSAPAMAEDDEDEERDFTPPSRAALTAAELRMLGVEEEHVQRIMRGFRPTDAARPDDGAGA